MADAQPIILLDGAMGTALQAAGLAAPGLRTETLCITQPQAIEDIHRAYVRAGAQRILCNTFMANARNLAGTGFAPEAVIEAAVTLSRRACVGTQAQVLLDVGPIGELMQPYGALRFDDAYALFAQMVRAGVRAGAQGIYMETFSDLGELRAAVLAAKEHSDLPVYATMTFDASGRTFLGCRAEVAAMTLHGLGVDALGVNCSLGPQGAAHALRAMRDYTDKPLIFKPNAGLPDPQTGLYALQPEPFARDCAPLAAEGVAYFGGCCGTTPAHIRALYDALQGQYAAKTRQRRFGICSPTAICPFGEGLRVVGERINPTGKPLLAAALRAGDMEPLVREAEQQAETGADALDVNVGLPDIDEAQTMRCAVEAISASCNLPLQIDATDPAVIEAGLRAAPGKCLINSVNASAASLRAVLPLARKYGAAIVALTLDEHGLPDTQAKRLTHARTILQSALAAGIPRQEIVVDCLTMTVGAQQAQAGETLRAVRSVRETLGLETMLGVSNISFGLPGRALLTRTFLAQAAACGLGLAIANPQDVADTVAACRALSGEDVGCAAYIARRDGQSSATSQAHELTLAQAIERGHKAEAERIARQQLTTCAPLSLVEDTLIPTLDRLGAQYAEGTLYLPQLMRAAEASSAVLDAVREALLRSGAQGEGKGPIVLATVQGDIHDIGKNLVRAVLESYGYHVVDLGIDVSPEQLAQAVRAHGAKLVGLSALMTTTVPAMRRMIEHLRAQGLQTPVVAGGAVLDAACAKAVGAQAYARDAKDFADIARRLIG